VLEGKTIKPHRNRDAADEGGVVLADQDHLGYLLSTYGILSYPADRLWVMTAV
jgi:hypothetical protein